MAVQSEKKIIVSIYDYPEDKNPFRDDDHKSYFWKLTKSKSRKNSFSDGFKEFKRTWSFRNLMKKGRKDSTSDTGSVSSENQESPIMYRAALGRHSTMSRTSVRTPEEINKYFYGGSVTPLPRYRFHERGSLSDAKQVNGNSLTLAPDNRHAQPPAVLSPRSSSPTNTIIIENRGSVTSLQSNNPFETSVGSVRSSARKKRRAPPPPKLANTNLNMPSITVTDTTLNTTILEEKQKSQDISDANDDIDIHAYLNIQLKITEDIEESNDKIDDEVFEQRAPVVHNQTELQEEITVSKETKETIDDEKSDVTVSSVCHVSEKSDEIEKQCDKLNDTLQILEEVDTKSDQSKETINEKINDDDFAKPEAIEANKEIKKDEKNMHKKTEAVLKIVEEDKLDNNCCSDETNSSKNLENAEITSVDVETKSKENNDTKITDDVVDKSDSTDSQHNNNIESIDHPVKDELEFIAQKISLEDNVDNVFKKVNVENYKRQQSKQDETTGTAEVKLQETDVNGHGTQNDAANNHGFSNGSQKSKVVVVKSGYIGHHEPADIIKENARRRSEFFELDKCIQEIENIEFREKNVTESDGYQRRRVSDMKLLFDNPNPTSTNDSIVNPIPKPRRSRSTKII